MVDLSNLKLVEEVIETVDDSQYKDATEFPPPIPEGLYTFVQGKPEFSATDAGFLSANMTQTVAGGEHDGAKVAFDRVSDKPFDRSGVKVSMMQDQIRAVYGVGAPERSARTRAERAAALEAAEGKPFQAKVQWDGFCNHKDTEHEGKQNVSIKGQRSFPDGQDVPCPTCGKSIRPRARINIRVSAQ